MKLQARPKGLKDVGRGSAHRHLAATPPKNCERLVSVAIIRDGGVAHGHKSHWELRAALGDERPEKPKLGDAEGFFTSEGVFVDRERAAEIGKISGQVSRSFSGRELLSSDVNWRA